MTRTVSRPRTDFSNTSMSVVGYLIFTPLLVLLLPVVPVVALLWLGGRLGGA